jgi:Cu-Zn family superoxide dismutase
MAVLLLLAASGAMTGAERERKTATAKIKDGKGQNVGQAKFNATRGGVEMAVTVMNLSPGPHAIYIHEAGKCDPPHFNTAGTHFSPANKERGTQNAEGHHAGGFPNLSVGLNGKGLRVGLFGMRDPLPNLTVGANGKGTLKSTVPDATLAGAGANSLFRPGGTSLVIHEKADDMKSDPAANAAARTACGVIR